jgi:hypothetical protein
MMRQDAGLAIETALIGGDLSKLTAEQRVSYYKNVCDSLGLNPLTQPFAYITLNGKLTLYARKDAADQLRRVNGVSIEKPEITFEDEWIIVTVAAHDNQGRTDSDVGVVNKKDMRGDFGNALMKAVTKAKRRVTLSICGLGMLDETEVDTIPDARPVPVEVIHELPAPDPAPASPHWIDDPRVRAGFWARMKELGLSNSDVYQALGVTSVHDFTGTKDEAKAAIQAYIDANTQPAAPEYDDDDPGRPF